MRKKYLPLAIATAMGLGSTTAIAAVAVGSPNGQTINNKNNPSVGIEFEGMAAVKNTNNYLSSGPLTYYHPNLKLDGTSAGGADWEYGPNSGPNGSSEGRGWTHNSTWAHFTLDGSYKAQFDGSTANVNFSTDPTLLAQRHPGFTIWKVDPAVRTSTNFAGGSCATGTECVPGHLWPQDGDWGFDSSNPAGSSGGNSYTHEWMFSQFDADLSTGGQFHPGDNTPHAGHNNIDRLGVQDGNAGHLTSDEFVLDAGEYLMVVSHATEVGADGNPVNSGAGLVAASLNLTAVPVPAAVYMLGSGLFGLIAVGRRKLAKGDRCLLTKT